VIDMIKDAMKKVPRLEFTSAIRSARICICNAISSLFPMNKEILLESHPDFTCNTYELFRYMISQGLNETFKITWLSDGNSVLEDVPPNVYFLNMYPKGFFRKFKFYVRRNRARIVIDSNRHIQKGKTGKKQLNIYLDHGSQLKDLLGKDGTKAKIECDYLMCQSEFFIPYNVAQYTVEESQIICTGLPRNDQLFRHYDSLRCIIPTCGEYKKIIIWVPTFRQHKNKIRIDCMRDYPLGLPVLSTEADVLRVNDVLKDENVLLIVKPHPAQDLSVIKSVDLSNIRYISNYDLSVYGIQMNELLAQTDAMITDYSSIYYDYLLLHRPIAITLDDFDDYAQDKGFVFEDPLAILKGEYIYDLKDFCAFIINVSRGIDSAGVEREEICDLLHKYQDDNSSKRVLDFIMEEEKKRFGD